MNQIDTSFSQSPCLSLTLLKKQKHDQPSNNESIKQNKLCNKTHILCWIPSYFGICENGKADKAAKNSLKINFSNSRVLHNNFKAATGSYILNK